jgi:hypothetical protein
MFGRFVRRTAITFAAGALLAACSATVAPTTSPPSGQATAIPSSGPSTGSSAGPIPSPEQSSSPAASAGSSGPAGSPGDIDPCTLLSVTDLATINGGTYGPGISHTTSSARLCVWQNTSPGESVTVGLAGGGAARYAAVKASLQGFSENDITTVADAAFVARHAGAHPTGGIYVQDGDTFMTIVYLDGTVPTDAQLVGVALEVVGQLP